MGETCRECRPLYTSSPWHMSAEALEAGAVTEEVGVILCPKHSEVDALRKEVERLREAAADALANEHLSLVAEEKLKDALRRGVRGG